VWLARVSGEAIGVRPDRRRAWLGLTAALCVLAYAGGFAHLAIVQHARCPAHDELVHAVAPDAAQASEVSAPSPRATRAPTAERDGHEGHCLAVFLGRRSAAALDPSQAPGLVPPAPGAEGVACASCAVGAQAVALLRLAPKTSPPAAAL
jgi:hypothetical protein